MLKSTAATTRVTVMRLARKYWLRKERKTEKPAISEVKKRIIAAPSESSYKRRFMRPRMMQSTRVIAREMMRVRFFWLCSNSSNIIRYPLFEYFYYMAYNLLCEVYK